MSSAGIMLKSAICLLVCAAMVFPVQADPHDPLVIKLNIPASQDSAGGMIVADVDGDGKMDYLVTVPGHLAVYGNDGKKLWIRKIDIVVGGSSEREGLPGHNGPGVAAGDVDGDGKCEVVFLSKDSVLHVVDGATGAQQATASPRFPQDAARWDVAMIADFRGTGGDRDILLQTTNKTGYRMGKFLAAYSTDQLLSGLRRKTTMANRQVSFLRTQRREACRPRRRRTR